MVTIEILEEAARRGGEVLKNYFRQTIEVSEKANMHDVVTKADKESQQVVYDYLTSQMKDLNITDYGFIGEENLYSKGTYMFIIDPLDGTTNYAAGLDYYAVSIALLKDGDVILSVLYDVPRNKMISAQKGKGTYLDSKRLVLGDAELKNSIMLVTGSSDKQLRAESTEIIETLFPLLRNYRKLGAVVSDAAMLLDGVGHVLMCAGCRIWDISGAKLAIEEAGGVLTDFEGQPLKLHLDDVMYHYKVFAGKKNVLDQIQNTLSAVKKEG
jgi:myo-inositol-1(or 4)-monophosphatase